MNAIHLYRLARYIHNTHVPFIPKIVYFLIFFIYNSSIPYTAIIGRGSRFGYGGMGVVIHSRASIGENCIIGQQVTIGGRSRNIQVPSIGNNVYISTGAKIIGNVKIGDNCVIGANAVVIHDVPSGCVVVGVPAKVVKTNINISDYLD